MEKESSLVFQVYQKLLNNYGRQDWWPADDDFEIMLGAILTQNTNWKNVEKAIQNLKQAGCCNATCLAEMEVDQIGQLIRSSGYYNQKASRLKTLANWYLERGRFAGLSQLNADTIRRQLLELKGIGEETADDICLYAFEHPYFVIDTYTRRIFSRLALLAQAESYQTWQQFFHQRLDADAGLYQQYHALIVQHAKYHCLKQPSCPGCPLLLSCEYGQALS